MAPTVLSLLVPPVFVGAHTVRAFLAKEYNVEAVVRSEKSGKEVLGTHPEYKDRLYTTIVADITDSKAYEAALEGVIHTASPIWLETSDYNKELFQPAIDGTIAVPKAVKNSKANINRVVITSSVSYILDLLKELNPGKNYTESDWNPVTREDITKGNSIIAYLASKALAENAAWEFVKEHSVTKILSLPSLNPPFIYGPLLHHIDNIKQLNTSFGDIYRLFNGLEKEVQPTAFWAFVNIRGITEAHVLAYEKPAAAGQRYNITSSAYIYQQIVDIIHRRFPEPRDKTP